MINARWLLRRSMGVAVERTGVVENLGQALNLLEAHDLIRRDPSSQIAGERQFTLRHMLIPEVAYATVPRAKRRSQHAAVAGYIEETRQGSTDTLASILAYHWGQAQEPAKAIPYLLSAARSAQRGWAKAQLRTCTPKRLNSPPMTTSGT